MPNKITISFIEDLSPSIMELKAFALKFSKEEWEILCDNRYFIDCLLDVPVEDSHKLSLNILNKR